MNDNWYDGIYEEVINLRMNSALKKFETDSIYKEKIDPEIAPVILSDYIAKIIKRKLESIQEDDSIDKQIELINKLVEVINDSDGDKVFSGGEQLKALLINSPIAKITNTKADSLIRPSTSIAETSLFTNAAREPSLSSELIKEIASCDQIDMMVSFIRWSGIVLILEELRRFVESGKKLRVITTSYMGATELRAIEELSKLPNTEIKVSFDGDRTRLHAKVYIFHRQTGYSTAYVGSSNLTAPAMTSGCEWNVKVTKNDLPDVFEKIEADYAGRWNSRDFELYTDEKRELLKESLLRSNNKHRNYSDKRRFFLDVYPYPYQQAILDKLEAEREIRNSYRNLICAATGTGKTIISAFDYRKQCEKAKRRLRLLFVAHRREILEQSIECYRDVLKESDFADVFFSGHEPSQIDYLFASVDILNSRGFTSLSPDYYDYIVIDECHHLAANSYKILFNHFEPKFFIGLTATPERLDGESILPFFNDRLAAEIRLPEAINRKLLCPFQYFGVSDSVDLSNLKWTRGGYDKGELENVYVFSRVIADKRAALIIQAINKYVADIEVIKGLAFCVSIEHAKYMCDKLNEAGINSIYLSGNSSDSERAKAKTSLMNGDVKFICVVDLYNEGVDIRDINTVLFLRPTESLTVFLQQLGRGLRPCDGKDCLTVLDFVGQANKRYKFEKKYAALLHSSSQGVRKELENGFQHLPKGCYIKLEKKAKEIILSNIKNSLNGKKGIEEKIHAFKADNGNDFSLRRFMDYYSLIPKMIYTHKITITESTGKSTGSYDINMWKKLFRLSSIDSAEFLSYMKQKFTRIESLNYNQLGSRELYYWKMLFATFIDDVEPISDSYVIDKLKLYWINNKCFMPEVQEIMEYNYEKIDFIEVKNTLPYTCALNVYSTYTRSQALSLLDYWKNSSEGVTRIKEKNTTCLFITLNKGNNYYSPSIAYNDYSINEELFHWQSQNATGPNTSVGQRYINQKKIGEIILLFVREQKEDIYGPSPFMFLGKADFVSCQGGKPMNIVWKLDNKIPARFLEITDKLGIG